VGHQSTQRDWGAGGFRIGLRSSGAGATLAGMNSRLSQSVRPAYRGIADIIGVTDIVGVTDIIGVTDAIGRTA